MHVEALTETSRVLFPKLSRFQNFYLVGGTALALQIGHRLSVDFDMFTDSEFPPRLLAQVKRIYEDYDVIVTYNVPGQLNIVVKNVKMTFFEYGYPPLEELVHYQGVPVLPVIEIAASKAFSIGKRLSFKDYVDWYFMLLEKHVTIAEVIGIAEKKYGNDFNDRLFLSQLASLNDIHEQPIDYLRDSVTKNEIQEYLVGQVKSFKF